MTLIWQLYAKARPIILLYPDVESYVFVMLDFEFWFCYIFDLTFWVWDKIWMEFIIHDRVTDRQIKHVRLSAEQGYTSDYYLQILLFIHLQVITACAYIFITFHRRKGNRMMLHIIQFSGLAWKGQFRELNQRHMSFGFIYIRKDDKNWSLNKQTICIKGKNQCLRKNPIPDLYQNSIWSISLE